MHIDKIIVFFNVELFLPVFIKLPSKHAEILIFKKSGFLASAGTTKTFLPIKTFPNTDFTFPKNS